MAKMEMKPSLL